MTPRRLSPTLILIGALTLVSSLLLVSTVQGQAEKSVAPPPPPPPPPDLIVGGGEALADLAKQAGPEAAPTWLVRVPDQNSYRVADCAPGPPAINLQLVEGKNYILACPKERTCDPFTRDPTWLLATEARVRLRKGRVVMRLDSRSRSSRMRLTQGGTHVPPNPSVDRYQVPAGFCSDLTTGGIQATVVIDDAGNTEDREVGAIAYGYCSTDDCPDLAKRRGD